MKNFLICREDGCLDIILHALPECNDPHAEFQWYLMNGLNDKKPIKLEKDTHESFVLMLTTEPDNCIRYKEKYVYCHYQTAKISSDTKPIFLTDDLLQLISRNQFHEILFYSADGMIRSDISYICKNK